MSDARWTHSWACIDDVDMPCLDRRDALNFSRLAHDLAFENKYPVIDLDVMGSVLDVRSCPGQGFKRAASSAAVHGGLLHSCLATKRLTTQTYKMSHAVASHTWARAGAFSARHAVSRRYFLLQSSNSPPDT